MGTFIIEGGKPLYGTVKVSGCKNAALPILFSTILTNDVSEIYDLPDIGDVNSAIALLGELGVRVTRLGARTLVDPSAARFDTLSMPLLKSLRASTYLIGACLSRFGRAPLCEFGGCNFSSRPIDLHIYAAKCFGACEREGELIVTEGLSRAVVEFNKPSVGATVNALLMAASVQGESILRGCAVEPHVLSVVGMLRSMGAKIECDGSEYRVRGGRLHGGSVRIGGDPIEAGTFLAASMITGGRVRVLGVEREEMTAFIRTLEGAGARFDCFRGGITAISAPEKPIDVTAAPYPLFPTDLQPIVAPLMAKRFGGRITDKVFPTRFGYLGHLGRLGLSFRCVNGSAEIYPSVPLSGESVIPDLRGGAALLLWALAAEGVSVIDNSDILNRGYERIAEKIAALGGQIELKNN